MTERNQIEIDYCPTCRGVWLDKGELDKMLDYAARNTSPSQFDSREDNRAYKDDSRSKYPQGHQKPQRKKSFLGDLFDFD